MLSSHWRVFLHLGQNGHVARLSFLFTCPPQHSMVECEVPQCSRVYYAMEELSCRLKLNTAPFRTVPEEERMAKYTRLLTTSLLAVKKLLTSLPQRDLDPLAEKLAPLLAQGKFWKYGKHKSPQVRGGGTQGCHLGGMLSAPATAPWPLR